VRQLLTATAVYQEFPGPAWTPGAVLTDGDSIVAVGPAAELTAMAGEGSTRTDLGTAVIIPGFIDAHVHLCFDASDDPVGRLSQVTASGRDSELSAVIAASAAGLLAAGVTTARDLGAPRLLDVQARERIRSGQLPGPDLLLACQPLTTPRGHAWYMGGECAGTAELIAAVHAHRDAGAEWIKLMVSGGFLTDGTVPAEPQFELAALRAVTDAAHEEGLRVAAHAHSTRAIRAAALAGVDTIEHATFIAPDGIDFDPGVADLLAGQRIAICPTANAATATYPAQYGTEALGRIGQLHAAGVPVIMGTDAGVRQVPGRRYADGMLALHQAGFTAADVLAAATSAAADALGLTAVTGRLLPGLRADLVALPGDPLRDLGAAREPLLVMANGALAGPAAKAPPEETR
jgi:imidazolonepropionase-like amidohydrolase